MLYFFLILIRVFLSWFPNSSTAMADIRLFIHRLTDPYMKRFRGIKWMRFGMFDFSPVLGLALLSLLLFITQRLSVGTLPRFNELLFWLLDYIWSFIAFLAMLFAIVMIIRLITLYTHKNRRTNWMDRLDSFLFPRLSKILGLFTQRSVAYSAALGISAALIISLRIIVGWLLRSYLFPLLIQL